MAVQQKIRIYDLAKELKLDNKRVIEDARREGIDVSVPSNTVPMEVAERIRTKYFPKKAAPVAGPRLVKHARPVEPVSQPEAEALPAEPEEPEVEATPAQPTTAPATEPARPEPPRPSIKILKKAQPQPQPAALDVQPSQEAAAAEAPAPAPEPESPAVEPAPPMAARPPVAPPVERPRTQVRVLRPQPGMTLPPPQARVAAQGGGAAGAGMRAVAPEAATSTEPSVSKPRTTYVPQDTGRPRKRTRRGKRGFGDVGGPEEGKHIEVPRHMRGPGTVVQQKAKPVFTELRPIKLVEGTTLKDFAERLEVKAKDVV
jgi:translation initiation factor IF-2